MVEIDTLISPDLSLFARASSVRNNWLNAGCSDMCVLAEQEAQPQAIKASRETEKLMPEMSPGKLAPERYQYYLLLKGQARLVLCSGYI